MNTPGQQWDFSKLPESEYERAKQAYAQNKTAELIKIHNQYKLSANVYCCSGAGVLAWFKWAIEEKGIIK